MISTYRMTLEYDGTRYQGFRTKKKNCIENKLTEAVSAITGQTPLIHPAVNTDPGMHARKQILSLQLEQIPDPNDFVHNLNQVLPSDIVIRELLDADSRFRADYALRSATYTCQIDNSDHGIPFGIPYLFRFPDRLDIPAMEDAIQLLTGSHDFASFTSGRSKKSTVRTLTDVSFSTSAQGLFTMDFTANGFLRHMPQLLAGTLLEIGSGKRKAGEIPLILSGESLASPACSSKAFCLTEVLCQ